jgi:hypothetical protein
MKFINGRDSYTIGILSPGNSGVSLVYHASDVAAPGRPDTIRNCFLDILIPETRRQNGNKTNMAWMDNARKC